jgi:signal transduction histidine kinase
VLDTGPGIAPDKRQVIFEKFSQLDSGHTKEHQGAGLGLAIAKEFAELLQGEIQVESEPGRGSMFSLIIPLSVDRALLESAKARMVERAALAGRRIGDQESRTRALNGHPS